MKRLAVILLHIFAFTSCVYAQPVEVYRFSGVQSGEKLGRGIACIGQFGPGSVTSDFVFGQPGVNGGRIQAFNGANGVRIFLDNGTNGSLGSALAPLGDADNDGATDFVAGDPSRNSDTGGARIYYGPNGSRTIDIISTLLSGTTRMGAAVAGLFSDGNSNGSKDVIFGAPEFSQFSFVHVGYVGVADGATGVTYRDITGLADGDFFGASVDSIGDYDNDGVRDVVAGAPGAVTNTGTVYIYSSVSGGGPLRQFDGLNYITESGPAHFGDAVATMPDVNGDGHDDIVVGAPDATISGLAVGQAFLISGGTGAKLCQIDGTIDQDGVGKAVAAVGDTNKDGFQEFAVGSPGLNNNAGAVRIYNVNGSGICTLLFTLPGNSSIDKVGVSIAGRAGGVLPCDINGDKVDDFGVGTDHDPLGESRGEAIFFAGPPPTPTPTVTPTPTSTPTVTPTPAPRGQLPTKSSFTYRISRSGVFVGVNTMNRDPQDKCTVTLYGRYTDTQNQNRGPVVEIAHKRADKETLFGSIALQKADYKSPGRPYIFHMLVKNECKGQKPFYSNVFARKLTCGVRPALSISQWEQQLAEKVH